MIFVFEAANTITLVVRSAQRAVVAVPVAA